MKTMKKIINKINEDFFDDVETEEIIDDKIDDIKEQEHHYKYFIWYTFPILEGDYKTIHRDIIKLKNKLEYAYDSLFQFVDKHSELKIYKDYPLFCKDEFRRKPNDGDFYIEYASENYTRYVKSLKELMIGSYVDVNMKTISQFDRFINFIFGPCNSNSTVKIKSIKVQIQEPGKNCYDYAIYNPVVAPWWKCGPVYKIMIDCFFPLGAYGKYCEKHNYNNCVVNLANRDILYRKDGFIYTDEFAEDFPKIDYKINTYLTGEEDFIGTHYFKKGNYYNSVNYNKIEQPPIEEIQKWIKNRKMDLFATWRGMYYFYFIGSMVWNNQEWSICISVICKDDRNVPIVKNYTSLLNFLMKYGCSKSDLEALICREVLHPDRKKIISSLS